MLLINLLADMTIMQFIDKHADGIGFFVFIGMIILAVCFITLLDFIGGILQRKNK